jgi:hypothetical protein
LADTIGRPYQLPLRLAAATGGDMKPHLPPTPQTFDTDEWHALSA